MSELPKKEDFAAQLETNFKMFVEEAAFEIKLTQCKTVISNEVQECFSLLFLAPEDAPPFQSIYRLEHGALGVMELFLVPVKKDEKGLRYEAVFNNLIA